LTVFQALVLGIVQGLTEFVPVSSSAHLIIVPWLFGWNDPSLTFDIALHLGTLVALVWFFARDWVILIRAAIASVAERHVSGHADRRLAWLLVIASIPGGIAGLLAESRIEEYFHKSGAPNTPRALVTIAIIIFVTGIALFIAERVARHVKYLRDMSLKNAVGIGLAQAFSILPGVSRSGSTITAGLASGFRREDAARFSFLLGTPMIAGAGLKSLYDIFGSLRRGDLTQSDLLVLAVGFLAAVISGYFCIKFLLRFLQRHSTNVFAYYRWLLAALIIGVVLVRG
jgi:undecaprenyl-diphosphatase